MRALHRYFVNPFDARGISLSELEAFATDHYQRMRAQNRDGALDDRLAATETALADLNEAFTGDLGGGAARKARKMSKRRFRQQHLPPALARVFAFLTAHFGPRSPQVRALGRRKDYLRSPDDALDNRLRTLHQLVAAHQATIGDTPVELAAALVAQWDEIYRQSESATGTKSRTESELRRARRALQWELYRNLLRLVELHPRQPEAYASTCSPTCSSGGNGRIRAGKARLKRVRSRGEEGWVG